MSSLKKRFGSVRAYLTLLTAPASGSHGNELPSSWFGETKQPKPPRTAAIPRVDVAKVATERGLAELVRQAQRRFPQQEQPDLLPDLETFDPAAAKGRTVQRPKRIVVASRRSMGDQLMLLQKLFADRSELMLWHSLAISYLRRDTPHTNKAKSLFFRIWDAEPVWLSENLNPRWLISALQTFADHGRSPAEIRAGGVGYVYGSLVKVYECEVASAFDRRSSIGRYRAGSIPGMFEFQPGDDALFNLNTFVTAQGLQSGPAGAALVSLVAQVKEAESLFSRTDKLSIDRPDAFSSFTGRRRSSNSR